VQTLEVGMPKGTGDKKTNPNQVLIYVKDQERVAAEQLFEALAGEGEDVVNQYGNYSFSKLMHVLIRRELERRNIGG
jgi:hypothetical protein